MRKLDRRALACVLGWAVVACGDDEGTSNPDADGDADSDADADADADSDADTDGDGDGDADSDGCVAADTDCTAELPVPGGPCAVDRECTYDGEAQAGGTWTATCVEGAWSLRFECEACGGVPVPPLAELCLDPFAGTMGGARVEVGPISVSEPFRPFDDGELVTLAWGAQGSPMLAFRVRVGGVEAPECIGLTVSGRLGDDPLDAVAERLALHCGASRPVYVVLPRTDALCSHEGPIEMPLSFEAAGLGATDARLQVVPGCPL